MNTPPFMVAAALLFWGSQVGLVALAALLAAALETSRLVERRWDLSRENQHRLSDLCAALFAVVTVVLYVRGEPSQAAGRMMGWAPLFFAPLLAAQAYSAQGAIDAGAFFWSQRRGDDAVPRWQVDVSYAFAGVCLLAAGGGNTRSAAFYPAAFALTGWALWSLRPRSSGAPAFLALLTLAGGLGHEGHRGLNALQPIVEQTGAEIVFGIVKAGLKDPFKSSTAIGSIGALKRSDRIFLRVAADGALRPPSLLQNASYDLYKGRDWLASGPAFTDIPPSAETGRWELAAAPRAARSLRMSAPFAKGQGVLALPLGAFRVEGLPAGSLRRSRLGAIVVEAAPGSADFVVRFGAAAAGEPPSPRDLAVPEALRGTLTRTARELGLGAGRPRDAMAAVARFFAERFTYTLYQEDRGARGDPLEDFLLRTKAGHCEHFATATVLLLRAAGVPARYATGFAVSEFSRLEGAWIVRQRHAHAWASVFVDGAWTELDTTPSSWVECEDARAPAWLPLEDLASWLRLEAGRALRGDAPRRGAVWGLAAVALYLAWRLRGGLGKVSLARARRAGAAGPGVPGLDSELYAVEAALAGKGRGRRASETAEAWALRVDPAGRLPGLARLHERYRFDPAGLSAEERAALRAGAVSVLADFGKT